MPRIIVTGGAGFIGSHLVERLLECDHEVLVIDNLVTGRESNLRKAREFGSFHYVNADICSEIAFNTIVEFKPVIIVHLAGQMNVRKSVEDPLNDARQNIFGTLNILKAAERIGVEKFIFSSTGGAIYGEQEFFPADESHAVRPECPYGISKRAVELYLEYYAKRGLDAISLRFGNVYGNRQNPEGEAGVISIFIEQIVAGLPLTINGDGNQTRDFIFVGDIVQAITLVIDSALGDKKSISSNEEHAEHKTYNLGTGVEVSVNDIAEMLKSICNSQETPFEFSLSYRPQAKGEQIRSLLDAGLFRNEYNWEPLISVSQGLQLTFMEILKERNIE